MRCEFVYHFIIGGLVYDIKEPKMRCEFVYHFTIGGLVYDIKEE